MESCDRPRLGRCHCEAVIVLRHEAKALYRYRLLMEDYESVFFKDRRRFGARQIVVEGMGVHIVMAGDQSDRIDDLGMRVAGGSAEDTPLFRQQRIRAVDDAPRGCARPYQ